jgi:hypothetical protein
MLNPHTHLSERSTLSVVLVSIGAIIPVLYLVWVIATCGVDVPFWDQWSGTLPLIDKSFQGTLTLRDLWHQHNEHRLFFPRLLLIPLARMTHWDIRFELWMSMILSVVSFGAQAAMLRRGERQSTEEERRRGCIQAWALPGVAVLLFSVVQWENWLWGFQMAVFLNMTAVIVTIALLTRPVLGWGHYLAGLVLTIVASYSFANGLVLWPIGLVLLLLNREAGTPTTSVRVSVWALVGVLTWVLYFTDYRSTPHPRIAYSSIDSWVEYIDYVMTYLGSPLSFGRRSLGFVFGLGGLLLLFATVRNLIFKETTAVDQISPALGLGGYALGSALVTGFGRSAFGGEQALTSRYTSVSVLFWIALLMLQFALFRASAAPPGARSRSRRITIAACLVVGTITAVAACNSIGSYHHACNWRERLIPAQQELLRLEDDHLLKRLYPRPGMIRIAVRFLKRNNLSVFRNDELRRESP